MLVHKLAKKPTNEVELVELETTVQSFRDTEHAHFLSEFAEIKEWMDLVWDCDHLIKEDSFAKMGKAAACVQQVGTVVAAEEQKIKYQREELESRFREERSKFTDDLMLAVQHVGKFAELGHMRQMDEYIERILGLKEKFERAKYEAEKLNEREVMLGFEPTEFASQN